MKTLNERIQRLDAAVAALKETAATLPPELQVAQPIITQLSAAIRISTTEHPSALNVALSHFGREGWTIVGNDKYGITVEHKQPNGLVVIMENIKSPLAAIGADATPYLQ